MWRKAIQPLVVVDVRTWWLDLCTQSIVVVDSFGNLEVSKDTNVQCLNVEHSVSIDRQRIITRCCGRVLDVERPKQ